MRRSSVGIALAVLLTAASHATAGDVVLTAHAGGAFGGVTEDTRAVYGGDLSFFGDRLFGFELGFAYAPDFFGGREGGRLPDNNLMTANANLLMSGRIGDGLTRVYASGGLGLIQARVDETEDFLEVDSNELGFNLGGGVLLGLGDRVGLRADLRYFRALTDPEPDDEFDLDLGDLEFWRATAGLSIAF